MSKHQGSQILKKPYYTTGELADLCHVSPVTIFRAITNQQLKAATTPGGHFRIAKEQVEDFLKRNRISSPALDTKTKKILIVEDNTVEARFYTRSLKQEPNYKVETTGSGYIAGYLTKFFKPDLILLDIFLEDIDGREVAKMVRSDEGLKHTKIVAITGTQNGKALKEIKTWGFDGFIAKPISSQELRKRIQDILK